MRYLRWFLTVALLSLWYVVGMTVVSALTPVQPAERHASAPVAVTPTLPSCPTNDETGAGMALCYWNAQAMGNGRGTSVVSGDCAPMIMGDEASKACVILHGTPGGPDLVGECISNENAKAIAECIREVM
jgi:hypothetical protein